MAGKHINDLMRDMFDEYGGVVMIDWLHAQIHAGRAWMATGQVTLGSGGVKSFLMTTSATQHTHLNLTGLARATGEANVMIYRSPPDVTGGTPVSAINMNDEYAAVAPKVTILEDLVLTDIGTEVLYESHFGSGQVSGGESSGRNELEFAVSTSYLIVMTSEAASNDVSWDGSFYEPKDI